MHIILSNILWMSFNIFLALVAVLFGWFMKRFRWTLLRILSGVIWIIFLPNTLYLLTDIIHFFPNMHRVEGVGKIIVVFQYFLLLLFGVITYFAAVYPAEKVVREKTKWNQIIIILLINGLVSFGIMLGRVERTNSWYFVTDPSRILHDTMQLLASLHFFFWLLIFTILSTFLYFSLRASLPLTQEQRDR
jgi:uncharacterized membrane protein